MPNTDSPQPDVSPLLGCIADDVTGATDLASNLVQGGMRVVQLMGVPTSQTLAGLRDVDAVVIALKTRSVPAEQAVDQSLASLNRLKSAGIERFYYKYCSTFDSTPRGNIGPVAEALMNALAVRQALYCPAFPAAGRTVYRGHLFVGDRLLHESGMESHPLNPMTDANLVRVLSEQATRPVGLLPIDACEAGPGAIREALSDLAAAGFAHIITDATNDRALERLAEAVADSPLLTGGSGLARFLPVSFRNMGLIDENPYSPELRNSDGRSLILAGSCSRATQAQVCWASKRFPHRSLDVSAVMNDPEALLDELHHWAASQPEDRPLMVSSTADADAVLALQARHGADQLADAIESIFGELARRSVSRLGVRRLVVAGGETSGAVTHALGIHALRIGPAICPGVPWTQTLGDGPRLDVAFKSGNFGSEDFFGKALEVRV